MPSTEQSNDQYDDHVGSDTPPTPSTASMEEWRKFHLHFVDLLNPKTSDGFAMFAFLRRTLRQFNLKSCSEAFVMQETYSRIQNLMQKNQPASPNASAWIRKVAFEIIQELSRNN